jgi:flagellar L-ring protein precursor FlgH
MRSEVRAFVVGAALVAGIPASAADPVKTLKASPEYEALYNRYLELARQTPPESPNGPRWIDGLFSDPRARAVNDLLTVRVVESISGTGSADASLNKTSSANAAITHLFGAETKIPGDPTNLVGAGSDSKFQGGGVTSRTGELTTNLTVRVAEVLPNGNLVLEGAREIQINGDTQLVVLTGVVRAVDVGPGNVILSTAIGDLRVGYVGKGPMRDSITPGWLIKFFNKIF